jgi:hypothetical protein
LRRRRGVPCAAGRWLLVWRLVGTVAVRRWVLVRHESSDKYQVKSVLTVSLRVPRCCTGRHDPRLHVLDTARYGVEVFDLLQRLTFSDSHGLQHVEHTVLIAGEGGRLELHVACLELPGVVRFLEVRPGVFSAYEGPMPAKILMTIPSEASLTYGWWWSRDDAEPREQSRAEVRRTA